MKPEDSILYEVDGAIATITLNRPEVRNALNIHLREGIRDRLAEFDEDPKVRVLIITGSGDVAFSSGADLKEMSETALRYPPKDFIPAFDSEKPIIASVNGLAWGGGFWLTQQADLVIAADHATFGITEARFGRGSPWAAPLPAIMPPRLAMEMIITAQPITAKRAYEVGFVNAVVPLAGLKEKTLALANLIAENAPLTIAAGKKMLKLIANTQISTIEDEITAIWKTVYESEDGQEGPLAFLEKRKPNWKNR